VYEVKFHPQVRLHLEDVPKNVRSTMRKQLETIVATNPANCAEGLTGPLAGFYSYHCEEYRIVYRVLECHKLIVVLGIGKKNADHYAEIYKSLELMARAGKLADGVLTNLRTISPS